MTAKPITAIIMLVLLLLFPNLVSAATLDQYPGFLFEGGEFRGKIVVGKEAPSMDVASAIQLIPGLQERTEERIRGSMLDVDVTDYVLQSSDIITLGCENEITKRILGGEKRESREDACDLPAGEGYIFVKESPLGNEWLVIAGGTPEDTAKAAAALGEYEKYELKGHAIKVTGAQPPYTIEEAELPVPEIPGDEVEPVVSETEEAEKGYEYIEEPDYADNPADRLQKEMEQELQEIEEKNKSRPEKEEPVQVDRSLPVYVQVWERFKTWLSWFFR